MSGESSLTHPEHFLFVVIEEDGLVFVEFQLFLDDLKEVEDSEGVGDEEPVDASLLRVCRAGQLRVFALADDHGDAVWVFFFDLLQHHRRL